MRIPVCFNKECPNFQVHNTEHGHLVPGGHDNNCLLHEDIIKCNDYIELSIIHDKCGLPVELCTCPDAPVYYDWEKGVFVDRRA